MIGRGVTLRELRLSDAASLCALLTTPEVGRFITTPPQSVAGFEAFIEWTHHQRACGQYICFAVVPEGCDAAVGVFQIRELEPGFRTAEWGFAIGSDYWGSGLFEEGAPLVIDFAFAHIGTHRLEARAAVKNGRGNGALAKLGAAREAILSCETRTPSNGARRRASSAHPEAGRTSRRSFRRAGPVLPRTIVRRVLRVWPAGQACRCSQPTGTPIPSNSCAGGLQRRTLTGVHICLGGGVGQGALRT